MNVITSSRRGFLRGAVGAAGAAGAYAAARPGVAAAGAHHRAPSSDGTVVLITLVGGVDGLSVLVPLDDPDYVRRRPSIAIGGAGERHGAIDLGRGLGLHPALAPLYNTVGRAERLAVIGGVGIPDREPGRRSHVAGRAYLHRGGQDGNEGWATRLLRFEGLGSTATWSFGPGPHPVFEGLDGAVAAPVPGVRVGDYGDRTEARQALAMAHGGRTRLAGAGSAALAASAHWSGVAWTDPAGRAALGYPEGRLATSLAHAAEMIRADRGLRIVAIDHGGYDTHVDQGDGHGGHLAHRLDHLARGLAAFWAHLGDARGRVVVAVVSEFGRTIDENSAGGTEHGRAGVALVIGEDVVGGVHGDPPPLGNPEGQDDRGRSRDHDDDGAGVWPVTIDVRRVLADAAWAAGFEPWRGGIFPGLALPNRSLGLLLSP